MIKFTAAILNINNWEACQYLVQAFSLPISLSGGTDRREEIERRQRERQRQEERKQVFRAALLGQKALKAMPEPLADIVRNPVPNRNIEDFEN